MAVDVGRDRATPPFRSVLRLRRPLVQVLGNQLGGGVGATGKNHPLLTR